MQLRALILSALAALPAAAASKTFKIDPAHSVASFQVKHLMVSNVRGQLGAVSGSLVLDKDDVTKSTVEATIDIAGISTHDDNRDKHLRSPDFFDTAKFAEAKFKSTKVEKTSSGLKVHGDLTLHGVTKPVALDVEGPTAEVANPFKPGATKVGVSAKTTINRKEFGVSWNKTLDSGGAMVGEDVKVEIELELDSADEAKPAAK